MLVINVRIEGDQGHGQGQGARAKEQGASAIGEAPKGELKARGKGHETRGKVQRPRSTARGPRTKG